MSVTVWSLVAVCAVMCIMHRAPVVSQPTMPLCHNDDDRPLSAWRDLVDRIQDNIERQQEQQAQSTRLTEIVERQRKLNEELLKLFNNSQEQQQQQNQEQHKQLTRIEETLAKQDKRKYCLPTIVLFSTVNLLL